MTENSNGIVAALRCRLEATRIVASDNTELGIWATEVHGRDVDASRNGGPGVVASCAERFGLGRLKPVMSIGLGTNEVSLLESLAVPAKKSMI